MKIRIQGNSIRFRLKQFEVEAFKEKGTVKEIIAFGDEEQDRLQFILQTGEEEKFSLEQDRMMIRLNLPKRIADEWTNTEMVGFEEKLRTSKGKEIRLLVEKDFQCLDRTEEEEAGSYPNPMKHC